MKIKDRILNKVANFVNKYKSNDYDKITNATIFGNIRGALTTYDSTYIKPLDDKTKNGLISIKDLLDREIGDSKFNTISFCENDKVVCINNKSTNRYVETVHECFDNATENIYVICDNKESFNLFRDFVNQSSKYHIFLEDVEEIPLKKTFENLFNINKKSEINENIEKEIMKKEEEEIEINKNYIQIDGRISKIGNVFQKKDGVEARFIEIEQNYEYNGKVKQNTIPIMLEGEVFKAYANKLEKGDKISLTGTLSTYLDKNKKTQSVINSYDIEILNRKNSNEAERYDNAR